MEEKVSMLKEKYEALLEATSVLFERTTRRHRSNKDLERTVKFLRSLYNQVAPKKHSQDADPAEIPPGEGYESLDSDDELLQKTTFMVDDDKDYRQKKRAIKERGKYEAKRVHWSQWLKQRAQILSKEEEYLRASAKL